MYFIHAKNPHDLKAEFEKNNTRDPLEFAEDKENKSMDPTFDQDIIFLL